MKPIQRKRTRKASKLEPTDSISNLPDNVLMLIMDRLPLQDAVRTGVLSRSWRSKWTTLLSQFICDEIFLEYLKKNRDNNCGSIIHWLSLNLKGVITKFVIHVYKYYSYINVEAIILSVLFFSKEGIKDLAIGRKHGGGDATLLSLPIPFFSCFELKHLKLHNCSFDPPTSFHGFPNLLSLELSYVKFESGKFGEFFTRCPLLETLDMGYPIKSGKVKLAEITKLMNLKILYLSWCNLDNTSFSNIVELVSSLPKLQDLHLDFLYCQFMEDVSSNRFLTTSNYCINTLKLSKLLLDTGEDESCLFKIMTSFPNLQTLEIGFCHWEPTAASSLEIDYTKVEFLQLQSIIFNYCSGSNTEVSMIKYLLACSPVLKKIVIRPHSSHRSSKKFMFTTKLLKLHRASPTVDISVA